MGYGYALENKLNMHKCITGEFLSTSVFISLLRVCQWVLQAVWYEECKSQAGSGYGWDLYGEGRLLPRVLFSVLDSSPSAL